MKKDKKKIILYVTFIPYIYIVFSCIYYAIFGLDFYAHRKVYGIEAIGDFLGDFAWDFIDAVCNPLICILVVFWIGYQIYYFVSFKKEKNESKKSFSKKTFSEKTKIVLFYISILCWVLYFLSGIFAFFFGSATGGRIIRKNNGIWNCGNGGYIILELDWIFNYTSITNFVIIYNYLFDSK